LEDDPSAATTAIVVNAHFNVITSVRKIRKQGRDRMKVRKGGSYRGYFLTGRSADARSGPGGVAPARPARL
jgi:hypothetical protein